MDSFQKTQEQRGTDMVPTDWAWFVAMAMAVVGFAAGAFFLPQTMFFVDSKSKRRYSYNGEVCP